MTLTSTAWTRLAALALATTLGACASGPKFVAPEPPPPGQAMLYIYRAGGFYGAGLKHQARVAGAPVGTLVNASYLRTTLSATPLVQPQLDGCAPLRQPIAVQPGNTYYVQASITNKNTVSGGGNVTVHLGCVLEARTADEALPVIAGLSRAD
jgi:hypothetical protein